MRTRQIKVAYGVISKATSVKNRKRLRSANPMQNPK